MLETLDTLIAFATVLVGVSLMITLLNQMIGSLLGYRATYLKDGTKDLLETLDSSLVPDLETIVSDVLTHKLASDSIFAHQKWAFLRWRMATSIRPQELGKLLTLVSAGKPYEAQINSVVTQINPALQQEASLIGTLAPITTPAAAELFKGVGAQATKAIGRLEAGFNSTMDRVRQRFTMQMRIWTIIFAVIFAFACHLDARKIFTRLATDAKLRTTVASIAPDVIKTYAEMVPPPAPGKELTDEDKAMQLKQRAEILSTAYKDVRGKLFDPNLSLFDVPDPWCKWQWSEVLGILAMAGFLSLGAPFWYNVLTNLVNLRSQVAQKQKQEEQAT